MQCVILGGGQGTRMRPWTEQMPKPLIPLLGRPFIDYQMEWLASNGVDAVVVSIGYKAAQMRTFLNDGTQWGISVICVDEGADLRGTAGALRFALDQGVLDDQFLVLYGDSFLPIAILPVWEAFLHSHAPALMTVYRNHNQWDTSNVAYENGRVVLYDKQRRSASGMDFIDYGLSILRRDVVAGRIDYGGKGDLSDLFHQLSLSGELAGYEVHERFYEIGSPAGLAELTRYLEGATRHA